MAMQLMVGVPLELSQRGWLGKLKVLTLYMAGVLLGSVAGAIPSRNSLLCGASAGVYALIAAHLATLIINWKEDGAVFKKRKEDERDVSISLHSTTTSHHHDLTNSIYTQVLWSPGWSFRRPPPRPGAAG